MGAHSWDADWRIKSVELVERNAKGGPCRYSFPCNDMVLGGFFNKNEASFKAVKWELDD